MSSFHSPQAATMNHTDDSEEVPLPTLYLQIQYANSPYEILGISSPKSTSSDLRDVFRALALRIHPDKAPSIQLRELHTSLFQKVFDAYETLLKQFESDGDDDGDGYARVFQTKQLPETEAALHARNIAFKEALRDARDRAIAAKHAEEARREALQKALQAKNERLAAKREEKAAQAEHDGKQKAKAVERRRQGDVRTTPHGFKSEPKPPGPLRNKPTAKPSDGETFSGPAATKADISHRWDKQLLSGGGAGSVSLALKKEREQSAAARFQKEQLALCEESDKYQYGLKATVVEEELHQDLADEELMVEKRTDEALRRVEEEIADLHLVEEELRPAQRHVIVESVWDDGDRAWS